MLNNRLPAAAVRDKIVFVGTTALGTREVVATPLDTLFAGVEVQATIADNLLEHAFVRRSPLGSILDAELVLAVGLLLSIVVSLVGVTPGLIVAAIEVGALWGGAVWSLSTHGLDISPLFPTIGIALALAVMTFAKFAIERRRAKRQDGSASTRNA